MQQRAPNLPVYPDPAGKARTSNSTKSDHMILTEAGFVVIAKKANPTQKDRLNALNKKLKDANGKHSLFIKSNCTNTIRDLEMTTMENGQMVKTESLSHNIDALCYPIHFRFPLTMNSVGSIKW